MFLMGTILLVLVLEATRRSVGPTLPIIAMIFMAFALFGPYAPGALKHGGTSWLGPHQPSLYDQSGHLRHRHWRHGAICPSSSSCLVFWPPRIGLGQLFIDFGHGAGRTLFPVAPPRLPFSLPPSWAPFSGSSIANTVDHGRAHHPGHEKRLAIQPIFAGAVEATSSTGGQITPPILGAAAFIMVEYLEIPLRDVLAARPLPSFTALFRHLRHGASGSQKARPARP